MCTVVGYIGKSFCSTFIFEGLARLEYRGYDSAGFACIDPTNKKILCLKASGQLANLTDCLKKNPINGFSGIGHTRWSTHGNLSQENAHPHFDCSGTIAVVHNGIIENYNDLKTQLQSSGHIFYSDTDSEVIGHMFEFLLIQSVLLPRAIASVVQLLQGTYAFIVMSQNFSEQLLVVRKKSPLCIGIGDGEMFVASDVIAFAGKTDKVFFLPDESFAIIDKDIIYAYDFYGNELVVKIESTIVAFERSEKTGYKHFMLKEIYEQKSAIAKTVESLHSIDVLKTLNLSAQQMYEVEKICFVACGTSWHAARIAQFFFESVTKIPVSVYVASEFRYMPFFPEKNTLYIIISQSGETADALEALRLIKNHGIHTIALTNVATSTIVREADGFLLTHAGFEVAVASTKAFSTQLAALYWLAYRIAVEKKLIDSVDLFQAEENLLIVAYVLESTLERYRDKIEHQYAPHYAHYDKALFLGRHISYPLAMESALKLKEIAYVFAQSYPAGELKHGPLALVDDTMLVYILSHQDLLMYQKLLSNAHEVKARGGRIIAFTYKDQKELCDLAETYFVVAHDVPALLGPLAMIGLIQYFVYAIAKERGCPIDKPRNLAKSVTVE